MVSVGRRRAATGRGERGGQYLGVRARLPQSIPRDGVLSGTILSPPRYYHSLLLLDEAHRYGVPGIPKVRRKRGQSEAEKTAVHVAV
jgi:hypothetical protein